MVELVAVIGIITILAAILFPVFAKARESARTQSCRTNLFNIGLALRMYAVEHGGKYPPREDDLSPLLGKYLIMQQVFVCPSGMSGVPMGAPADKSLPLGESGGAPGGAPGGMPGAGGLPQRMTPTPPGPGPVTTSFYYRAGRKHNQVPRAPLVSDQDLRHNDDRANVLFSDGAIETLRGAQWRALGFRPLAEIMSERNPTPKPRPRQGGGGDE